MPSKAELVVEDRKIQVSNLDKVLYPKVGFTKGQVIDYYIRIASVLLPHLKDRPLTMKRYPDGVEGEFFYEKNCPSHRPKWVQTAKGWSESNNRRMNYCLVQDLATLVWAANLADLELHTSLSRKNNIGRPTMMAFDLDPGAPADIVHCCQVGLTLRARPEPTVSTPVTWEEVEHCLKNKKAEALKFRSDKVIARIEKLDDSFEPVEKLKQRLPRKQKL